MAEKRLEDRYDPDTDTWSQVEVEVEEQKEDKKKVSSQKKEKLKEFFSKYLDLIFRVGLMITIISVWDSLTRMKTSCYFGTRGGLSESELICIELRDTERIFRDFISDIFPLVIFLSIFYVVFWFFKKDR